MQKASLCPLLMLTLGYGAFAGETANLLTNPGAETGDLRGWTAACTPSPCTPPTVDSGSFDPGINPRSGSHDFVGGPNDTNVGTLTQAVTLAGVPGITAAEINSGKLLAHVSYWAQGLPGGFPGGQITLTFLSASNAVLGTADSALEDQPSGSWQQYIQTFPIPPNTATINYTMNFYGNGNADDAFFDDNLLSVASATGADSVASGVQADFLGQFQADYTVWRPSTSYWYSTNGSGNGFSSLSLLSQWGAASDLPVLGDFDGDGKSDLAVFRPSTGEWYIVQSSNGAALVRQWGESTDTPVTGDFDGDGKTDIAVFRPSTGYWYIVQSSSGEVVAKQWGESTDIPVAGDFDGDGKSDIAVYRPSIGYWYVVQSSNGEVVAQQWGESTDIPVAGDFDGDGRSDVAVYRPSTGYWYIIQSSNGEVVATQWGQSGDIPVARDYDGDGKTDIAVFRPASGYWYVIQSSNGEIVGTQWGAPNDVPVNGLTR